MAHNPEEETGRIHHTQQGKWLAPELSSTASTCRLLPYMSSERRSGAGRKHCSALYYPVKQMVLILLLKGATCILFFALDSDQGGKN